MEYTQSAFEPKGPAVKNFDVCIGPLLEHEGGNDDDPQDPGGRTSRGITQREWDVWRRSRLGLPSDVWNAPQTEVLKIYKQNYWDKMRCDDLPAGVDYAVFDYGVNSGVGRAAKVLQGLVGVEQDGEIGPQTIAAASTSPPVGTVNSISVERLNFLRGLSTWPRFGRGWTTRVNDVKALALKMAAGSVGKAAPPPVLSDSWLSRLIKALFGGSKPVSPPAPQPDAPAAKTPPWMAWAAKEVGFHETGENRDITRYTVPAKCGSEGDPWCAIFVNAALESTGVAGSRSAMARSFEHHPGFVKLDGPAYGAITTMWRGSPSSGTGHCFFYVGHLDDSHVLALGGNQSDQVCRQAEPLNRMVGFYWPKGVGLPKIGRIDVRADAGEGTET